MLLLPGVLGRGEGKLLIILIDSIKKNPDDFVASGKKLLVPELLGKVSQWSQFTYKMFHLLLIKREVEIMEILFLICRCLHRK